MDGEIIGGNPNPTLEELNKKAIQKLYELLDGLEGKSDPDMLRACVESLAKLNTSIKGSNMFDDGVDAETRREQEITKAIIEARYKKPE